MAMLRTAQKRPGCAGAGVVSGHAFMSVPLLLVIPHHVFLPPPLHPTELLMVVLVVTIVRR